MNTILHYLLRNATNSPDQIAIEAPLSKKTVTNAQLWQQSQNTAAYLRDSHQPRERVILLYDNTPDFFSVFLGTLLANLIPVPLMPPSPRPHRLPAEIEKLYRVCQDCDAKCILTTPLIKRSLRFAALKAKLTREDLSLSRLPPIKAIRLSDHSSSFELTNLQVDNTAFLQYTSGSTHDPKGVMITHTNIIRNTQHITQQMQQIESAVTWAPCHHDLGIMSGLFMPLFLSIPSYLLSPMDFMKNPNNWLKVISSAKNCYSAGPNFAYEYCCKKFDETQLPSMDLSTWRYAGCGAEKNHADTLTRFIDRFARYGFQPTAFAPAYGLAEHTVCVCGFTDDRNPLDHTHRLQTQPTPSQIPGESISLPHGRAFDHHKIRIINPQTLQECDESTVGEIWCQGPSVARGYWNQESLTQQVFHAYTKDGQGPFLRTGDLGFLKEDQLHITGRIKDSLIINGKNHAAEDIEWALRSAHPNLRPGGLCAVSLPDLHNIETAAIFVELYRSTAATASEIISAIQQQSTANIGIRLSTIVLLEPGTLHKTTSGKCQRQKNKRYWLDGKLPHLLHVQLSSKINYHTDKKTLAHFFKPERK